MSASLKSTDPRDRYRPICARCRRQVEVLTIEVLGEDIDGPLWRATAECHGQIDERLIGRALVRLIISNTLETVDPPMAFDGARDAIVRPGRRALGEGT